MGSIVKAVFTLTSFTLVERVLGFIFKIYLSRQIGAVGIGVYSVALSFFLVLLTLITSGVPLVVSKSCAKTNDKNKIGSICSAALIIELIISVLICLSVLLLKKPLSSIVTESESMTLVIIMLPAIIFSGVYSAFRGCLWGKKRFISVSVVELIEQVARIVVCIVLFTLFTDKTRMVAVATSASCLISALACAALYFAFKGRLKNPRGELLPLFKSSVPITLSRTAGSLNNYLIALAVPFLLLSSGNNSTQAMYVFGSSIGMALPLLYLPITVVGSLAFVLIPTLSEAYAKNDRSTLQRQTESALIFSIVLAALFFPAYQALGTHIGVTLYDNIDSGVFLSRSAWLLVPLSVENIASSMLNSIDLEKKSLINYLAGAVLTFAIIFAFYGRFTVDVYTYALGAGLVLSSVLDIIDIKRRCGIKINFLKPLAVAAIPMYPSILLTEWIYALFPAPPIVALIFAAVTGFCFMTVFCIVFGAFDVSVIGISTKDLKERRRKKRENRKLKKQKRTQRRCP